MMILLNCYFSYFIAFMSEDKFKLLVAKVVVKRKRKQKRVLPVLELANLFKNFRCK